MKNSRQQELDEFFSGATAVTTAPASAAGRAGRRLKSAAAIIGVAAAAMTSAYAHAAEAPNIVHTESVSAFLIANVDQMVGAQTAVLKPGDTYIYSPEGRRLADKVGPDSPAVLGGAGAFAHNLAAGLDVPLEDAQRYAEAYRKQGAVERGDGTIDVRMESGEMRHIITHVPRRDTKLALAQVAAVHPKYIENDILRGVTTEAMNAYIIAHEMAHAQNNDSIKGRQTASGILMAEISADVQGQATINTALKAHARFAGQEEAFAKTIAAWSEARKTTGLNFALGELALTGQVNPGVFDHDTAVSLARLKQGKAPMPYAVQVRESTELAKATWKVMKEERLDAIDRDYFVRVDNTYAGVSLALKHHRLESREQIEIAITYKSGMESIMPERTKQIAAEQGFRREADRQAVAGRSASVEAR